MLELACGTGLWTVELARHATSVTAVDASPEVLGINRARLREAGRKTAVRYVEADLFDWRPDAAYDAVFFVDSLGPETPDEKGRRSRDPQGHTTIRRLDDGREFRIVKVFYDPATLERRLAGLGWNVSVHTTEHLLYGYGEPLA